MTLTNFNIKYLNWEEEEIELVSDDDEKMERVYLLRTTDLNNLELFGLKTETTYYENDKVENEIELPESVYTKSDFTEREYQIGKLLFDCIWNSDNGVTNYIDFDEDYDEDFSQEEIESFIDKFGLDDNVFLEEDSIGVTISYVTRFSTDTFL